LNVVENGTSVNEEVEVDVDEQTEVIRVPKHNNVDSVEIMNDFIGVISESMHRLSMYHNRLTSLHKCKYRSKEVYSLLAFKELPLKNTEDEIYQNSKNMLPAYPS